MKVFILFVCVAVAFASEEFEDGSGTMTCAEEYISCRKDAEIHDIKNIYQCGKNYAKCRAAPAVACVKGCHTTFLACRKANGILNRAQCYLDLAKCYTTCKIAPHHEDEEVEAALNDAYEPIVEDEEDEDEIDDGSGGPSTCVENYRECKKIAKSFKDKIDCGAAYLHCRGSPWTGCLRVCHVERKQCTRDADGFTQHAKCFTDFAKCAATCKLGPHNDEEVEAALNDAYEPIVEDEEDEDEIDDGSGGPSTCVVKYRECKKNAKTLKDKFACGKDYFTCRGKPWTGCMSVCHQERKQCTKDAADIKQHLKCITDSVKCFAACRPGPHNDELPEEDEDEDDLMMEDDDEMEDGSGSKQTCKEQYRECTKGDPSIKDRLRCGKEYLKCKAKPHVDCAKKCNKERRMCTKNANTTAEHWACVRGFPKCKRNCRKNPEDELFEDEGEDDFMMVDEDEMEDGSGSKQSCRDQYKECTKGDPSIADRLRCGKEYLKCKAKPHVNCAKKCHKERKMCTKNANTTADHWACLKGFPKCYSKCRKAPEDELFEDEGEDDFMMVDEDEMEDGSGSKQSCRDQYKECTKDKPSVADRFRCGKEYLKCKYRTSPHVNCAKKCHAEGKQCTEKANGWKERLACLKKFPSCYTACRKNE